ncbi:MAG: inorganic phosphate transporter, partial [Rhodobacteraceae bacterium]|nr:inorganic phosphate transporter [Paracoccaceae bacterium]
MPDLTVPPSSSSAAPKKSAIDKDLKRIVQLEKASVRIGLRYLDMSFGLLFVVCVWVFTYFKSGSSDSYAIIAIASVVGAYMAMNIGANDLANNVDPADGSKALSQAGALLIAAIFEAAG